MDKFVFDNKVRKLLEKSPIPYAIYQFINKRVVTCLLSRGFYELFGLEGEDAVYLMDHDMYRDCHPDDVARIAEAAYRFATEEIPYDVIYRTKHVPSSNEYFLCHAYGRHVDTDQGRLAVVWYVDEGPYIDDPKAGASQDAPQEPDLADGSASSTTLRAAFRDLIDGENRYAEYHYDKLTGLPTMPYFLKVAQEFRDDLHGRGMEPVMLFFDLNGMKVYNDRYGFDQGDLLLRGVADILRYNYSNENCGRFGPDHFAAFIAEEAGMESILEDLLRQISELNGGHSLPVRVGIYRNSLENVSPQTAVDRAKVACDYEKGGYVSSYRYFDMSMLESLTDRSYFLENLDRALQEGWIQAYYQPIVRSSTGLVCNEEALARWIDPQQGMIPPDEFIPVLEEARMLYRLDIHMVNQVLHDFWQKKQAGIKPVPVSVNLSWHDFIQCDMVEEISAQMDRLKIPHEMLNIEITERVIGQDPEYMKTQIDRFHEKGFHVWMDDFGSGYSSLDILQNFDFDLIKMNRDFMKNFDRSEKSRIIMTELIHMATRLGIDTLAEGVETAEQFQFLKEIGCNRIQGFYFSRPNPLEEVMRRYRTGMGIGMEDHYEAEARDEERVARAGEQMDFQSYVDRADLPAAVLSVEKTGDGYCGDIHIICANRRYRESMGPAYYDGMPYQELVPQDPKFEDFCFRAAVQKEKMQTYVRTDALKVWTDMAAIPLDGGTENLRYCMFMFEFTREPEVARMSAVAPETAQNLVSYCIRLLGAENFREGVEEVTRDLAQLCGAVKCRILLKNEREKKIEDFCETVNETSGGILHEGVHLPYELVDTWDDMIGVSNCVIIKDAHDMEQLARRNPAWAESLQANDIKTLFLVPLRYEKKTIGYLFLVNLNTDDLVELKKLVELIAYILGTELANYQMMQYLEWMSITDVLTGMKNRNSMLHRMQELTSGEDCGPIGIINMDVNELKTVNDTMGHDAGDDLLRYAAEIMKGIFGTEDLYRTGGDEFIALITDQPKSVFEQKLAELEKAEEQNERFNIAVGSYWTEGGVQDVEEALERADRSMYIDKKEYYERHPEKDRRRRI